MRVSSRGISARAQASYIFIYCTIWRDALTLSLYCFIDFSTPFLSDKLRMCRLKAFYWPGLTRGGAPPPRIGDRSIVFIAPTEALAREFPPCTGFYCWPPMNSAKFIQFDIPRFLELSRPDRPLFWVLAAPPRIGLTTLRLKRRSIELPPENPPAA